MLENIMNDEEVKKIINSINDVIIIDNCGCHGMAHALRVMNYVEIILQGIGSNEHDVELGKIAAYLHDVGAISGKSGHAERSSDFAEKYLTAIQMPIEDKKIIVHAIADHSGGKDLQSNIGAALVFADKIDMFKDRMLRFKENNYFHDNIKHMLNIEVKVTEDSINVNIVTDGNFDYNSLKDYQKMVIVPTKMAQYFNKKCTFSIDGQFIDLLSVVTSEQSKSFTKEIN